MKPGSVVLFLILLGAGAGPVRADPADPSVLRFLASPLFQAGARSDPSPEDSPSFGTGFRPESWDSWEVPDELRRVTFAVFLGASNFYRDATALKMDNPGLHLASSEYVQYQSLWAPSNVGVSLRAGLHVTPMFSLTLEPTFNSFRREVSIPDLFVVYQDGNNNTRLLSTGDLSVFTFFLCARLAFPVNVVLSEPKTLLKWHRAAEPAGFVPFFEVGAGVSFMSAVEATVYRTESSVSVNEKRALFKESWNLSGVIGIGLEYRLSIFGFEARATFSNVGKPASGWAPYTDAADSLTTYHLQLGISVSLF